VETIVLLRGPGRKGAVSRCNEGSDARNAASALRRAADRTCADIGVGDRRAGSLEAFGQILGAPIDELCKKDGGGGDRNQDPAGHRHLGTGTSDDFLSHERG
jgi:hypothetical protein